MENFSDSITKNPWQNISWKNTVADCDINSPVKASRREFQFATDDYTRQINSKKNVKLSFNDLPEPFYGDVNSDIYFLNMNPGEPDYGFCQEADKNGLYEKYVTAAFNHKPMEPGCLLDNETNTIIYDPDKYKKVLDKIFEQKAQNNFINNNDFPFRPHAGDIWRRKAFGKLRNEFGRDPKLFIIEYFPYHSAKGFAFPNNLPSYAYRNALIKDAINKNKIIIIMRNKKAWCNTNNDLGDLLTNYNNKGGFKCKGRIWITPGNIVPPDGLEINDIINLLYFT